MFKVQCELFVSRTGNNMYTKTPFRLPRQDFCTFADGPYRKYFIDGFKPPATDLWYTDDPNEKLCDIMKANGPVSAPHSTNFLNFLLVMLQKTHKINEGVIDLNKFPSRLENGMYKMEASIYNGETLESTVNFFIRIF